MFFMCTMVSDRRYRPAIYIAVEPSCALINSLARVDNALPTAFIYLHMAGAPSTLDLFDYKPKLVELNGKPCPRFVYTWPAVRVHQGHAPEPEGRCETLLRVCIRLGPIDDRQHPSRFGGRYSRASPPSRPSERRGDHGSCGEIMPPGERRSSWRPRAVVVS